MRALICYKNSLFIVDNLLFDNKDHLKYALLHDTQPKITSLQEILAVKCRQ